MKRIFDASPKVDLLLNAYTKESGVKIGKTINNTILCWFLPHSEPLSIEANYILQEQANGKLTPWLIKQSVSRGIRWLARYPINDCSILKSIAARYARIAWNDEDDSLNGYTKGILDNVVAKIKAADPTYTRYWNHYACLADDICAHWDALWQDKDVYEALSTIVFCFDPVPEISWYEGICYLQAMEQAANRQHGVS